MNVSALRASVFVTELASVRVEFDSSIRGRSYTFPVIRQSSIRTIPAEATGTPRNCAAGAAVANSENPRAPRAK